MMTIPALGQYRSPVVSVGTGNEFWEISDLRVAEVDNQKGSPTAPPPIQDRDHNLRNANIILVSENRKRFSNKVPCPMSWK
jgi:hypothetical protein